MIMIMVNPQNQWLRYPDRYNRSSNRNNYNQRGNRVQNIGYGRYNNGYHRNNNRQIRNRYNSYQWDYGNNKRPRYLQMSNVSSFITQVGVKFENKLQMHQSFQDACTEM